MPVNEEQQIIYHQCLQGGGEMGTLIRSYDWSETALGTPDQWPQSLLTTVGILLKSPFPMFLWWGEERIQFYNDAYRPGLGDDGKHPTALGQSGAVCWRETWHLIKPIIDQVLSDGESIRTEDQLTSIYRNQHQEEVYWSFGFSKVDNGPDHPGGVLVICTEAITEQVNTRKKVEQAEEMLRLSIEAANVGTWHLDLKTDEFSPSPRFKELFGYFPEEKLTYGDVFARIPDEFRPKIEAAVERAIATGESYNTEHPVTGFHDQTLRWIRALGKLYPQTSGHSAHFSGLILDITEQKQDEMRKNDFIGMVSHELKTPLTSLNGYLQLLMAKLNQTEDAFVADSLTKANIQVKKMSTMINGFLDISRLESGKIHLNMEVFYLDELIKEVIEEVKPTTQHHQIVLHPCKPVSVYADRNKIGSVISNLLSNAVKYSPKGKNIELDCSIVDNTARVTVKDQGMGIKPQAIDRLFERFYRVESKHTLNISGFGIGLYLCSEILMHHGGKIWAESKIGVGSTFSFNLPLQQ